MNLKQTSRLVLLDRHRNVLLAQRPFGSKQRAGELDFLGGACDPDEDFRDAALREAREEAGLQLSHTAISSEPIYTTTDQDGSITFDRRYFAGRVEIFPLPEIEHIGSVILPGLVALDLLAFMPHRLALANALSRY